MSKTKLGQILNKFLTEQNLTVSDFARLVKIPQPTIYRIVNGQCINPHISSLKPIAEYFSITVDQLKGLEPIHGKDEFTKVPLLDWEEISSWKKNNINDIKSSKNIITDAKVSYGSFALQVEDSSMEPVFPIKTILIIDAQKTVKDRNFVIVTIASINKAIFRQIIYNSDKQYLKALSPDLEMFQMSRITDKDFIIGVVVQTKYDYET